MNLKKRYREVVVLLHCKKGYSVNVPKNQDGI